MLWNSTWLPSAHLIHKVLHNCFSIIGLSILICFFYLTISNKISKLKYLERFPLELRHPLASLVGSWRPGGVPRRDARARRAGGRCQAARGGWAEGLCGCLDVAPISPTTVWFMSSADYTNINSSHIGDRDNSSGTMSKVEGGMKCVKFLLFVFNFIFWVSRYFYAVGAVSLIPFIAAIFLKQSVSTSFALVPLCMFRWLQKVMIAWSQTALCCSLVFTFSYPKNLHVCCIYS